MSDATPEQWLPVVGYEHWYEVSDLGRVRSWYTNRGTRSAAPRLLGGHANSRGYRIIGLYLDGVLRPVQVHVVVAQAFIGPRPSGMDVCHGNGDALDNRLVNLRYDTPKSNGADKVAHGRSLRGTRNSQHKLTDAEVVQIRRDRPHRTLESLAHEYGVCKSAIHAAATGTNWHWIAEPPVIARRYRKRRA